MIRIVMGSKGFFTSKDTSKTRPVLSNAQEESVRQLNPINLAFNNELANLLGFSDVVTQEAQPATAAQFLGRDGRDLATDDGFRTRLRLGGPGIDRSPGSGFIPAKAAVPEKTELQQTGGGVGERFANTLQVGSNEQGLGNLLRSAFGDASSSLGNAGGNVAELLRSNLGGLTSEFDPSAILEPLLSGFNQQILPGIRSKAIQFGAPSGSREAEVTNQSVESLGRTGGAALGAQELARRNQVASTLSTLLPQLFGFETAGVQEQLQGELAGGQADVSLDELTRSLAGQKELAPLNVLLQALSGGSAVPFGPAGSNTTVRERDSGFQNLINLGTLGVKGQTAGLFG